MAKKPKDTASSTAGDKQIQAELDTYDHEIDSPPWSQTTKALVGLTSLFLVGLVIWRFQSLWTTVVVALLIAYLLTPLIKLVQNRLGFNRSNSVLLTYFILLGLGIGGIFALVSLALNQFTILSAQFPDLLTQAATNIQTFTAYLTESMPSRKFSIGTFDISVGRILDALNIDLASLQFNLNLESLVSQVLSLIEPIFSRGGSLATQFAQATLNVVSQGLFIFIISIYIATDLPRFDNFISDLAHQPGYRKDADRLVDEFVRIWNSYLRGQVILGLVIGVIVSACLLALGVNNALALGLLSGLLEFLPILGPVIGTAAAILVAFFQPENYLQLSALNYALLIGAVMFAIQQLENSLLVPRIVGDALDLHPLVVMISVFMGAALAGILGAILAAPVVATIQLVGGYAWRKMFDLDPFPNPPRHLRDEQSRALRDANAPAWQRGWHRVQGWFAPSPRQEETALAREEISEKAANNTQPKSTQNTTKKQRNARRNRKKR
ncbi:MAG: AI-2E family transporter [Chloroflexota bacterium]